MSDRQMLLVLVAVFLAGAGLWFSGFMLPGWKGLSFGGGLLVGWSAFHMLKLWREVR
jgi:hypothetical protein